MKLVEYLAVQSLDEARIQADQSEFGSFQKLVQIRLRLIVFVWIGQMLDIGGAGRVKHHFFYF